MNLVELSGRLTADPKITQGENAIARFNLAVDRRFKRDGQPTADFIPCVAFGKLADVIGKHCTKGTKIITSGRIQTGSYTNKDGQRVYTTDVVIDQMEFAESKATSQQNTSQPQAAPQEQTKPNDFMSIPDGLEEELPFS